MARYYTNLSGQGYLDSTGYHQLERYRNHVFKYVSLDRIDFFKRDGAYLLIRFSQPSVLNDQKECLPQIDLTGKRIWARNSIISSVNRKAPTMSNRMKRIQIRKRLSSTDYRSIIRRSYSKHLQMIGILSLSKSPNNRHLWSNYAAGGFCIEFDDNNPFFHKQENDPDGTGELFMVKYSDTPVRFRALSFFCGKNDYMPPQIFYQKEMKWAAEEEVRIIRLRQLAYITDDKDISFFQIPLDAIVAIYLDPQSDISRYSNLIKAIRKKCNDIHIYHNGTLINQ